MTNLRIFPGPGAPEDFDDIDLNGLSRDGLEALLDRVKNRYAEIEAEEPEDEESDEYEAWMERLEDLDSLMDDIQDLL